jgi:hypothetical protein
LPTLASGAAFQPTPDLIAAPANNIGVHSMLYQDTPYSAKKEMFAQAKAVGASYIRLDLGLISIFTRGDYRGHPFYQKNWAQTDQYAELANRYGVKILANLFATPWFIADCPAGTSREDAYHCPPSDLVRYKAMVAEVAARYAGVIDTFEIVNEPDTARAFYGSPQQYARTLSAAADGVHGANPKARVAIGGVARVSDTKFTDAVLAADPSLPGKIDINTIHLRTSARGTAVLVDTWRKYFTANGMNGPLWLTEFGYPAETAFQFDAKFRGGESAQAAFLEATMPGIVGAGVGRNPEHRRPATRQPGGPAQTGLRRGQECGRIARSRGFASATRHCLLPLQQEPQRQGCSEGNHAQLRLRIGWNLPK